MQAVAKKRLCCLHCCKTRRWQGWLPQRCSFLTVSCHLSAQDRPQLIPTELCLSPGMFQTPPSTSSLLPHLDNQQAICCSCYPRRNNPAGTWIRCLTQGQMHQVSSLPVIVEQSNTKPLPPEPCNAHSQPTPHCTGVTLGLDRKYLLSYHSDLNYSKHRAWCHKGGQEHIWILTAGLRKGKAIP